VTCFSVSALECITGASQGIINAQEQRWLDEHPVIRLSIERGHEPFVIEDSDGTFTGILPDLIHNYSCYLGQTIELVAEQAHSQQDQYAKPKDPSIYGTALLFVFGTHDTLNNWQNDLLVPTGLVSDRYLFTLDSLAMEFSRPHALTGKRIAVLANDVIGLEYLRQLDGVTIIASNNVKEQLEAVFYRKADALLGYSHYHFLINKFMFAGIVPALSIPPSLELKIGVKSEHAPLHSLLSKAVLAQPPHVQQNILSHWLSTLWFPPTAAGQSDTLQLSPSERNILQQLGQLNLCIDPEWMPFEKNVDGVHIGISADYFEWFETQIGIPIRHVPTTSWTQSLELGKRRACDIFSLVMPTPSRLDYLDFTKPYILTPLVIASHIDTLFIVDIAQLGDKPLGIPEGYAYGEVLRQKYPKLNLIEVKDIHHGLSKVARGELFGFIGTLATVGYHIQQDYIGELKIAGKFDENWQLGVGTRNDYPELKDIFNKAIDALPADMYQHALNRWVSIKYEQGTDYKLVIYISAALLLVMSLIFYRYWITHRLNNKLLQTQRALNDKHALLKAHARWLGEQQQMVDRYILILNADTHGLITQINEAFCKALGYQPQELIGRPHDTIIKHEQNRSPLFDLQKATLTGITWKQDLLLTRADGQHLWTSAQAEPKFDERGKVCGYKVISEDITDKKNIETLAITDSLTGLYNRMKFDEVLEVQFQHFKRNGHPFFLLLIDIDNFKQVNDQHGHDIGDYVLRHVATILTAQLRQTDVIARWGGEEFIILCSNTDLQGALQLAEKIRSHVQDHGFESVESVTISMGISKVKDGDTIRALFRRADQNLYSAKMKGKNRVVHARESVQQQEPIDLSKSPYSIIKKN
jgi:diguanylate cyclase (GGDEF)-like protein/PAS domain S-box-containing protein